MSGNRYWSGDDIADIKNARGCQVPWPKIAAHFGVSVDEVKQAVGEPQWKREPSQEATNEFYLFRVDELDAKL